MAKAYLLLGSNIGDRHRHLASAMRLLGREAGKIIKRSSIYETAPWGNDEQGAFLNQAILIESDLSPGKLLLKTQHIEQVLGQQDDKAGGPRIIDIDILFYDKLVYAHEQLIIPHPRLHLRRFTLVPLQEIAPGFRHPELSLTIAEMLHKCGDTLSVQPIKRIPDAL